MYKLKKHSKDIDWYWMTFYQVTSLLRACLDFNSFSFNNKLYQQGRGLAMGSRLAPMLAVIYMDSIEFPARSLSNICFYRYIDDIIVLAASKEDLNEIFQCLNSQSNFIKLTREEPTNGWLPFLNFELRIQDNSIVHRWYRKPSSKNLLVRFDSFHPIKQKSNIVVNTIRTAKSCSTSDNKSYSENLALRVLEKNGYNISKQKSNRPFYQKRVSVQTNVDHCIMTIPFMGDMVTKRIRNILKEFELDTQVVELKGRSLKDILVKNRCFESTCNHRDCRICEKFGIGKCNVKGVIYKITCDCGEFYIGETGRPFESRFAEHRRACNKPMTKSYSSSVWAKHSKEKHGGEALVIDVDILEVERNTNIRKIREGVLIKHHNSSLNNKEELSDMITRLGTIQIPNSF
ncbi:unnamed protein product [Caenorhabditis angaria]|uniref:Reverse transcriptase domain-containing protein n=1 Tax=Caenorhabditis angaria TaxID=860376 RepID=A0A9P1N0W8_9PELO|nr:unnamed protein product [Caenorhabditis angaria]